MKNLRKSIEQYLKTNAENHEFTFHISNGFENCCLTETRIKRCTQK